MAITNPRTNQQLETALSNEQAIELCREIPTEFAQSLLRQWRDRGLSPTQWYYIHVLALEESERRKPKPFFDRSTPAAGGPNNAIQLGHDCFATLRRMFDRAAESIRWPKIRFQTDDYRLKLSVAGPQSRRSGTINVVNLDDDLWYGRIVERDLFERGRDCPESAVEFLRRLAADPVGEAAAYGRATGVCAYCHRELTDPRSVTAGFGPVCSEKWGIPWGDIDPEVTEIEQSFVAEKTRN